MKLGLRQTLLDEAYRSGAYRLIAKACGGIGAILMLHRIVSHKEESPARYLTVTASYLDRVITELREMGVNFVSMSDLVAILKREKSVPGRCVALTFDDGFRDNVTLALPVLEKHGAPATMYVPSGAPDRTMDVWFLRLERIVMRFDKIPLEPLGMPETLPLDTVASRNYAYDLLTDVAHRNIAAFKRFVCELLPPSELSDEQLADSHFLSWQELKLLGAHPLMTIGAHTESHAVLSVLSEDEALGEMVRGRNRLEQELGAPVEHFAYPYGGKIECGPREFDLAARAGFVSAVTTRYGNIYPEHRNHLCSLPRMTLGGPVERMADTILDVMGTRTLLSNRVLAPVVAD